MTEERSKLFFNARLCLILVAHAVGGAYACFVVWGWLTVSDIRNWAVAHKQPYEEVVKEFQKSQIESVESTTNSFKLKPRKGGPLGHLNLGEYVVRRGTNSVDGPEITIAETFPLLAFIQYSDNVLNTLFCAAFGYLTGLLIILIELTTKRKILARRIALRPITAMLSSALLFLVVLSGGSMVWSRVQDINGLSLAVISLVGALKGEKVLFRLAKTEQASFGEESPNK